MLPHPDLLAREDSARLVLQKTATSENSRIHVVKKGESMTTILRAQAGHGRVTQAMIRELNPEIRDMNRIYPGQQILLPLPEKEGTSARLPEKPEPSPPAETLYRIREGDSISRIILTVLNVKPSEALPTYRIIRKLNPDIENLNRIRAGQTLRLPATPPPPAAAPTADPLPPPAVAGFGTDAAADKPSGADNRLGMIRRVIRQMQGTVTATGTHVIPLQENAQVTIDCSLIPVVDLDDGTTVLLDYGDHLSEEVKGLISHSWRNYGFLAGHELKDGLSGIQGIVKRSRNYRMAETEKPLTLFPQPEILLFPDWLISGDEKAGGKPYRQGLLLHDRGERPLSPEARDFIEKSGIAITEFTADPASSPRETPPSPQPAIVDMRGLKGIPLAEKLLATLGEAPTRNAEVIVFDAARNGFNLSITADLLLRKGEKRFILQTKRLPEQFIQILRAQGTEILAVGENSQGRSLIEEVLRGVGIPVSYGFFSTRIPEEGRRPRLTASFSALKAMAGEETVYLIDFDVPQAAIPLFQKRSGDRVVRYESKEPAH